jgi:plastocyanin
LVFGKSFEKAFFIMAVLLAVLAAGCSTVQENATGVVTSWGKGPQQEAPVAEATGERHAGMGAIDDEAATAENRTQATEQPEQFPDGAQHGNAKTFVLTGHNFRFVMDRAENPEIRVKAGDTVRLEFSSTDGFHDWVLDEFAAATKRVRTGESTSVEFVAGRAGTFEYYCSVGTHRQQGMKGVFIVE